ncbi:MAG TPA: phosphodiester glycosidase family protein [Chthoniobacterales bacterium]|jgi:exopolysaccharide biosynthesis protein|nr:phosphodiester glycosidase family protein [Chthoniobacterales bacterium]
MAVKFSLTVALLLGLLAVSWGAWTVSSSETDGSSLAGTEHRRIVLTEASSNEEATLDLAFFSAKNATLRVVDNPNGGDDLAAVMRRTHGVAGVNGGYFDPQNAPVGLLISDGKLIAPLRKARLLSGVLVVTKTRVDLLRPGEYSSRKNVVAAVQCGPFLVDDGKAVAGLNNSRPARRTFVLTTGADHAAIGLCSTVTLAQLGDILATPELKTRRALNLDGGSSSAFWFSGERGVFSISEQKTVRDFVIVTPK